MAQSAYATRVTLLLLHLHPLSRPVQVSESPKRPAAASNCLSTSLPCESLIESTRRYSSLRTVLWLAPGQAAGAGIADAIGSSLVLYCLLLNPPAARKRKKRAIIRFNTPSTARNEASALRVQSRIASSTQSIDSIRLVRLAISQRSLPGYRFANLYFLSTTEHLLSPLHSNSQPTQWLPLTLLLLPARPCTPSPSAAGLLRTSVSWLCFALSLSVRSHCPLPHLTS